jgi:hypothetical protein
MRLANISKVLLLATLPSILATAAPAQVNPATVLNTVRDQVNQPAGASSPKQAPPQKTPPKPVAPTPKPAAPAAKGAPAPSGVQANASGKQADKNPPEEKVARRDPFDTLLNKARAGNGEPENLPPGEAGLVVATLRIDGIVRGKNGMIAIVSNPQQRVYFVREGDKLYDGTIEHITLEGVSFHEFAKDAFGKPIEREVTKRLYPSPGEQQ